jgi:hydrogenase expression/formation protein HypE
MTCPLPHHDKTRIALAHGGGGRMTQRLLDDVILPAFANPILMQGHDGAVLPVNSGRLAFTTDSFVVDPLFFNGGSIGELAVNGTINDLASCGARPIALSASLIIEEGLELEVLSRVVNAMGEAARRAGVAIVTGDTKVVDKGKCDKLFVNTSGIGLVPGSVRIHPDRIRTGDVVILSGAVGRHGVCILSTRANLGFETTVASDTAPLHRMTQELVDEVDVHVMRDATRGGLSSTLNELATIANLRIELDEERLPIPEAVAAACDLLGLDPLYVANEGVMIVIVAPSDAERALSVMRQFAEGRDSVIVGRVGEAVRGGEVTLRTYLGGTRIVEMLSGEQLPRIC